MQRICGADCRLVNCLAERQSFSCFRLTFSPGRSLPEYVVIADFWDQVTNFSVRAGKVVVKFGEDGLGESTSVYMQLFMCTIQHHFILSGNVLVTRVCTMFSYS